MSDAMTDCYKDSQWGYLSSKGIKYNPEFVYQKEGVLYERCVICGEKTDVRVDEHIDNRPFYTEGVGQLCYKCGTGS